MNWFYEGEVVIVTVLAKDVATRLVIQVGTAVLLLLALCISAGAVLVPVLEVAGDEAAAYEVFTLLGNFCHQLFSRSLWVLEHPMGICARCFAIYSSFFVAGVFLIFVRVERPLWKAGLLLLIPVVVDGGTQLAGLRESYTLMRVVTGAMAGTGMAMMVLPTLKKLITKGGLRYCETR